jgi:hypothetical protein
MDLTQDLGVAAALVAIELSKTTWLLAIHEPVPGKELVRDEDGTVFDSPDAAAYAAARTAAEIGTRRLAKGDVSDVIIAVRDEREKRVVTVTASMRIERHDLSSRIAHLGSA